MHWKIHSAILYNSCYTENNNLVICSWFVNSRYKTYCPSTNEFYLIYIDYLEQKFLCNIKSQLFSDSLKLYHLNMPHALTLMTTIKSINIFNWLYTFNYRVLESLLKFWFTNIFQSVFLYNSLQLTFSKPPTTNLHVL